MTLVTNTLAYHTTESIMPVKSVIVHTLGDDLINILVSLADFYGLFYYTFTAITDSML